MKSIYYVYTNRTCKGSYPDLEKALEAFEYWKNLYKDHKYGSDISLRIIKREYDDDDNVMLIANKNEIVKYLKIK